jgi:hypothetical protein
MIWKIGTFAGLGLVAILLVMRHRAGAGGGETATGAPRPDNRGATALEVQRVTLGPKAVAEAAKKATIGETKAAQREQEKTQRKG